MPLMFIVSGASLFYALGKGEGGLKAAGTFVKDKALRLLVPVVVCDFTHASLQVYLDRLTHGEFSGTYFQFLPHYFFDNFEWQGMHLWYLWLLFLFSILLYPLMRWLKGRGRDVLSRLGDLLARPGAVYALALPAILLVVLLDYDSDGTQCGLGLYRLSVAYPGRFPGRVPRAPAGQHRAAALALSADRPGPGRVFLAAHSDPLVAGPALWHVALRPGLGARALGSWCCVLAFLGFGRKHLNFSTPFLKYANEAVLPFYILHQTVMLGRGLLCRAVGHPRPAQVGDHRARLVRHHHGAVRVRGAAVQRACACCSG